MGPLVRSIIFDTEDFDSPQFFNSQLAILDKLQHLTVGGTIVLSETFFTYLFTGPITTLTVNECEFDLDNLIASIANTHSLQELRLNIEREGTILLFAQNVRGRSTEEGQEWPRKEDIDRLKAVMNSKGIKLSGSVLSIEFGE
jgi:hypothetical protein